MSRWHPACRQRGRGCAQRWSISSPAAFPRPAAGGCKRWHWAAEMLCSRPGLVLSTPGTASGVPPSTAWLAVAPPGRLRAPHGGSTWRPCRFSVEKPKITLPKAATELAVKANRKRVSVHRYRGPANRQSGLPCRSSARRRPHRGRTTASIMRVGITRLSPGRCGSARPARRWRWVHARTVGGCGDSRGRRASFGLYDRGFEAGGGKNPYPYPADTAAGIGLFS